ncbi:hypothetical protein AVEN_266359-1 [Araneus ventricosus]|uniref:Uncharacterized protein n=1 Tax=Araneus ventricosus TaxID=182803 RepID=A0A4Y2CR77_ARAVE|nr:hypothetical protein AVEN_266359-1 [Araneus ventricosus]
MDGQTDRIPADRYRPKSETHLQSEALFPRRVAWQTSSSHGAWLGKSLGSCTEVCQPSIHKHLMSDHLPTTNGKLRVTPQSLEQQRFFLLPRRVIKRNANQFDERLTVGTRF